MFTNAIVCSPCPLITEGITTAGIGKPVYAVAVEQHLKYTETLQHLGLKVRILPPKQNFPDSTFIEDVALCTSEFSIITSPGAPSRRGEITGMKELLGAYFSSTEEIILPGTLEAGDVMMVENHFYIGISSRTNSEGADQLIRILQKYGCTASKVPLKKMLHLKTGVSYLENNNLLACGEFINAPEFEKFNRIIVDEDESYSANSLWINGKVLVPDGFPKTREKIEKAGYETIVLNVSEFRKVDGGLSCLSIRF
jgi:dimethylargininase